MVENFQSIIKWHTDTFPDATLLGQLEKFKVEKEEWLQSQHITDDGLIVGDITELVDMFIVACGVARFSPYEALYCFRSIANNIEGSMFATIDLERAVDAKMEINRARKWDKQNGMYQHKEVTNEKSGA